MKRLWVFSVPWLVCSCAGPNQAPGAFPEDTMWRSVIQKTDPGGETVSVETRFASLGKKFRVEVKSSESAEGRVAVFDGERLVTNWPDKTLSSADFDLRKTYKALYSALARFRYHGESVLDGRKCWYYSLEQESRSHHVWVDMETRLPRRNRLDIEGFVRDEKFLDTPGGFEVTPEVFDAELFEKQLNDVVNQ